MNARWTKWAMYIAVASAPLSAALVREAGEVYARRGLLK